jgi:hypothetical protein
MWGTQESGEHSKGVAFSRLTESCLGRSPPDIVNFGSSVGFDDSFCLKHKLAKICEKEAAASAKASATDKNPPFYGDWVCTNLIEDNGVDGQFFPEEYGPFGVKKNKDDWIPLVATKVDYRTYDLHSPKGFWGRITLEKSWLMTGGNDGDEEWACMRKEPSQ